MQSFWMTVFARAWHVLFVFMLFAPHILRASETARLVEVASQHQKTLRDDAPFGASLLTQEISLWLAGATHLWVWQPEKDTLRKVQGLELPSSVEHLAKTSSYVLAAGASFVYRIREEPWEVKRWENLDSQESLLSLWQAGQQAGWLTTHRLVTLSSEVTHQRMLPKSLRQKLMASTGQWRGFVFDPKQEVLWFADDHSIRRYFLSKNQDSSLEVVFETKTPLRQLAQDDEGLVFARTAHTLMIFSPGGKLLRHIASRRGRLLEAMILDSHTHQFVFHDGLLERHHNQKLVGAYLPEPILGARWSAQGLWSLAQTSKDFWLFRWEFMRSTL